MLKPQLEVENIDESLFHKHLSKFSCLMIGIGGLIGGGIFSVIGVISNFTGSYSYISYLITGIIALFTVYSYQKLTSKWCNPGGEYTCVQGALVGSKFQNLGPFIGILLIFGYVASMALYSYTFSVYFLLLFNIRPNFFSITLIISFLFTFFIFVNLKGVKESSRVQNLFVLIKVIILIIFSIFGIRFALKNPIQLIANVGFNLESFSNINFAGIILGSSLIIVSYQGFQLIAYGAYEMEDREGGLKMMRWSLIISMIIYCFVAFTAVAVLGVSELIGEHARDAEVAIALAALNFIGNYGMTMIIIGALLSTASALNATLLGSSRLTYMMAKDGILPNSLSKISKNKVPYVSIIIIGILSTALTIVTGGALAIAGVAGLIFAQIFLIINFTNFKVRKQTNSKIIYPLIGMIFTFSFFLILIIYDILNIKQEIFSLISFLLIEGCSLFFVAHINHKNNSKNIKE
ncbi:MAG: APC family permease [Candidatus Hermodarchaeota archaeon]